MSLPYVAQRETGVNPADVLVGAEEHGARLGELLQRRRELLGDQ